jgi:Lon protease-like protein
VTDTRRRPLPLFPLQSVLFPGGLLMLKVFEARYLDLVTHCLRSGEPFGVVCLRQGSEVGRGTRPVLFESMGVLARIDEVDGEQARHPAVRCTARSASASQARRSCPTACGSRPCRRSSPTPDAHARPGGVRDREGLSNAIASLRERGPLPFAEPFRLDDAGWVANRWCELLPIPLSAKQKLMALEDPVVRLSVVDGYLRDKQVVR